MSRGFGEKGEKNELSVKRIKKKTKIITTKARHGLKYESKYYFQI